MISSKHRPPLRLAAVVPHTIARRGLESVFDTASEVEVIQMGIEATDLDAVPPGAVDAVLVVVTRHSGFDDVLSLASAGHRVLAIGGFMHRDDALAAGALEFLDGEEMEPDGLVRALQRVASGQVRPAPVDDGLRIAVVVAGNVGRAAMAGIFDEVAGYRVVATGEHPAEVAPSGPFDVVLLGVGRQQQTARLADALELGAPVLCFGLGSDRALALAGGASGFMRGAEITTEIFEAVDALARGETYFPDRYADLGGVLSAREREVIVHLARGCTDREIGDTLGISMRTVQSHLDRIREKTGRRRRAELTRLAVELGVAEDE